VAELRVVSAKVRKSIRIEDGRWTTDEGTRGMSNPSTALRTSIEHSISNYEVIGIEYRIRNLECRIETLEFENYEVAVGRAIVKMVGRCP